MAARMTSPSMTIGVTPRCRKRLVRFCTIVVLPAPARPVTQITEPDLLWCHAELMPPPRSPGRVAIVASHLVHRLSGEVFAQLRGYPLLPLVRPAASHDSGLLAVLGSL